MDYMKRAQEAYAQAEAATDPRDKAAFRGAAQTWEKLAKSTESAYSLEPLQRQMNELKKHATTAPDAPTAPPAAKEVFTHTTPVTAQRFSVKVPTPIEF